MVGIQANLCTYLKHFQHAFKVGSFDQSHNARRYLLGSLKVSTGKRNIQRISEQDRADPYQSIQHFISHSPWDTDSVKLIMQQINQGLISGKSYGYILDERSVAKKGTHSAGVGRQYCGSTGQVDNCQTGVYAVLTTRPLILPCNFRLYVPPACSDSPKKVKKAGLKASNSLGKTKTDLAIDMIRKDRQNGIIPTWYGGDALYGRTGKLTSFIEDECKAHFVMDTSKDHLIYLKDPTQGEVSAMKIEDYIATIHLSRHKKVPYEPHKKAYAHVVEVFTKHTKQDKKPRKRLLIISKGLGKNGRIKFSLSNFPVQEKTVAQLVYMQRARFTVEQYFRDASQLAGIGDHQVRSFQSWQHVQILSMLLMQLLSIVRKKLLQQKIHLSISAISRCVNLILLRVQNSKQIVFNTLANCRIPQKPPDPQNQLVTVTK